MRSSAGASSGANFVGEDLYQRLRRYLMEYVAQLYKDSWLKPDDSLLYYYHDEWNRFTTSMQYVNNLFAYLNRHWIKREIEDGKNDVYEVHQVHFSFLFLALCLSVSLSLGLSVSSAFLDSVLI
jgi:cullin 1